MIMNLFFLISSILNIDIKFLINKKKLNSILKNYQTSQEKPYKSLLKILHYIFNLDNKEFIDDMIIYPTFFAYAKKSII